MMSIGTAEEDTVRGLVRLPSTETVSRVEVPSVDVLLLSCAAAMELVASKAVARAQVTADANGETAFEA
jgi:hypothetical protein